MKENLIHYRTCVCNINYHMVWSVKYRRKILNPEIEEYLQELVQQIAEDKGFTVHLFECGEDRKSTRLNSSHPPESRMPSSA